MHTSEHHGFVFNCNGSPHDDDLVIIRHSVKSTCRIDIPFAALKGFVAEQVRNRRVTELNQASDDEILK